MRAYRLSNIAHDFPLGLASTPRGYTLEHQVRRLNREFLSPVSVYTQVPVNSYDVGVHGEDGSMILDLLLRQRRMRRRVFGETSS
jgi:hypothetical protein